VPGSVAEPLPAVKSDPAPGPTTPHVVKLGTTTPLGFSGPPDGGSPRLRRVYAKPSYQQLWDPTGIDAESEAHRTGVLLL